MVCVAGSSVTRYLGVNFCSPCFCVFKLLKDERPASLTQNEAASFRVERY